MPSKSLSETLSETADDLRDYKTVMIALPTLNAPESIRAAINNLAISVLDNAWLVLMKTALRIQRAEEAECTESAVTGMIAQVDKIRAIASGLPEECDTALALGEIADQLAIEAFVFNRLLGD